MTTSISCQTCYSDIPSLSLSSLYYTPCCSTPICDRCLSRNPRLREYIPCLRCGDVKTASGSNRIHRGTIQALRQREEAERGQFVIGDEDEEGQGVGSRDGDEGADRPPSYRSTHSDEHERTSGKSSDRENGHRREGIEEDSDEEEEKEIVEVTHPVGRNDTLLSIARRYAVDPHDLLSLNNLPPTALSSNPRIIQTRRTLIISRRLIPKSKLIDNPSLDPGLIESEEINKEEHEKRETEKRIKRFQLITKTTDPSIGKAYIALSELSDNLDLSDILVNGSGEAMDGQGKEKKRIVDGTVLGKEGREGRALEAFYEDERWESQVGGPSRVKEGNRWVTVGPQGVSSKRS